MPQVTRQICTNCQRSIYNVTVDGQRIPLVVYFVVGQPPDTGPSIDLLAPGVKVPSFVRELMQTPLNRIELCIQCFSDIFGLPMVTAEDDPMFGQGLTPTIPTDQGIMDEADRMGLMHERTLYAIKVGRKAAKPPGPNTALPKAKNWSQQQKLLDGGPGTTPKKIKAPRKTKSQD